MPSLSAIRSSNAAFARSFSHSPVAVFVGGTSGIGQAMAESFAEHTKGNSDIVIVGRNRAAAERILASFPSSSARGTGAREFMQCDVTLMKNVEQTTREILSRYPKINYLIMSPGIMTLSGRDETPEGIDRKLAVHYYARWKFLGDLLPALKTAREEGEMGAVMSVLGAGYGGEIIIDDLALKDSYSTKNAAMVTPTYNDLMLEAYAEKAANLSLIHANPGFVRTSLLASSPSFPLRILSSLALTLTRPLSISARECAEYMWNAAFTTASNTPGAYRIGTKGENLEKKNYYGNDEQRRRLWEHTEAVMKGALSR
ncbi:NAD-P-binding protein [Flammula alnicola]|nr:NAD-P-binding protein [Flammula alnicola]